MHRLRQIMGISSHVSGQSSTRPTLMEIRRQIQGSIRQTSSVHQKWSLGILLLLQHVKFIDYHHIYVKFCRSMAKCSISMWAS
jgi:hypothetical protein